jgi:ABC-2 type transport system permease protein
VGFINCPVQRLTRLAVPEEFVCGDYLILGASEDRTEVASQDGFYVYVPVLDSFGFTARPAYGFLENHKGVPVTDFPKELSIEPVIAWPAAQIPGVISSQSPPSGWLYVRWSENLSQVYFDVLMKNRKIEEPDARFEMARTWRTVGQSIASPVISTALYFVVFGSAIGSRIEEIDGVSYGSFIVPGLIMLSVLTQSISNASFGIYFPRFSGTIYEILSAPISYLEIIIGYVGAAATKSMILGLIILATATLFVPLEVRHPLLMLVFLILTSVTFSLFGFIIGVWADGFEKLQIVPSLLVTPLAFLGGSFYSIKMLPPVWQTISMANPVVYLISGFRWSFYEAADVSLTVSFTMVGVFLLVCISVIGWIFKTGYRLKD